MVTIEQAIISLRPNASFVLRDNKVADIEWHTEGSEPLTKEEVQAEIKRLEKAEADKALADEAATAAAIAHAKSLGFTEEMIAVMYPNLGGN